MSQNLIFLSITLLIFSISGCEKPPAPDLPQSNQKEKEDTMPPLVEVEIESETSLQTSEPQISPTEKPAPLTKAPISVQKSMEAWNMNTSECLLSDLPTC